MAQPQFYSFDTHGVITNLVRHGLSQGAAEELIRAIITCRDYELSRFVKLEDLADSEKEAIERFAKIETEIALIRKELSFMEERINAKIDGLEERVNGKLDELKTGMINMEQGLQKDMSSMEQGLRKDISSMEQSLRKDMSSMEQGLRKDMNSMEQGLRKDMNSMEERLEHKIEKSKNETIKWIIGMFIAQMTALLAILIKSMM